MSPLVDPDRRPRPLRAVGGVVAAALLLAFALSGCGSGTATGGSTAGAGATSSSSLAPSAPVSDLPTVPVSQLPPEAVTTLGLIAAGGPFPYSKDGTTFSNRERILPSHPSGWYREYTVVTPGSDDRGARRVVAGKDGGRFYTDDHYESFREVVSGGGG